MGALIKSAPPSLHSVVLILLVTLICFICFPSPLEDAVLLDALTATSFDWVTLDVLAAVRLTFGVICIGTTLRVVFCETLEILPTYRPKSKLQPVPLHFTGFKTQVFFTQWAWNMLTISFLLSGSTAFLVAHGKSVHPWILRIAHVSFEIAAPTELLVASVIKYAIWPRLLKNDRSTIHLKTFVTLMMHNGPVVMILIEVCFLGKIPILLSDIAVAPLFGVTYVFFSWYMSDKWLSKKETKKSGPQFLYFFLDTTLQAEASVALIILLLVLLLFYFLFWVADDLLMHVPNVIGRMAAVLFVVPAFCRFRD